MAYCFLLSPTVSYYLSLYSTRLSLLRCTPPTTILPGKCRIITVDVEPVEYWVDRFDNGTNSLAKADRTKPKPRDSADTAGGGSGEAAERGTGGGARGSAGASMRAWGRVGTRGVV